MKSTEIFGRYSRATALLVVLVAATGALSLVVLFSDTKPAEAQSTPQVESNAASWGGNTYGQLGDGTTTNRSTPVQVSGLSDVKTVAGGYEHSLAVKNDGTVWAWGYNGYGQLGDGTTTNRSTPVQVSGLSDVKAVEGGGYHSLAVKNDGTVWAWGYNGGGQVGDGTTTDRSTPVQVSGLSDVQGVEGGVYYSLAVKNDGTAWTWGETTSRTPVQVLGLTNVKAVAGGGWHRLAAAALDFIPPETSIADTSPSGTIASNKPSFTFSGSDNRTQTANLQYSYKVDNGAWSSYSTATSATLGGSGGLSDGKHTFYVRAKDVAGNVDVSPAERTFTVDTTAPGGTISINGDAVYSTSATVSLALSASDPPPNSGVASMRFSHDGTNWSPWEPYATSKTWTLTSGDGIKTVRVQYRDGAGNVSATAEDFITLDTTAPTVTGMTPADGAPGVAEGTNVTATFSEGMDPSTVNNTTFTLTKQGATASVAAVVSYYAATNIATLDPNADLDSLATYTATVTTAAKDRAGNALAANRTWSFTTADTKSPVVNLTAPADGATVGGTVQLTAQATDNGTVDHVKFFVNGVLHDSDFSAPYSIGWDSTSFVDGERVRIEAKTEDAAGNSATSLPHTVTVENAAPAVLDNGSSLEPDRGATGVPRTTNVSATFSEEMKADTLTSTTFKLQQYNKKKKKWKTVPATLTLSNANKTATLDPFGATETGTIESPLAANKKFRGFITTGVTDLAGNPLASKFIWTFKTGGS